MAVFKRGDIFHYDFRQSGVRYQGSTGETKKGRALLFEGIKRAEAAKQGRPRGLRKMPTLADAAKEYLANVDARKASGMLSHKGWQDCVSGWKLLEAHAQFIKMPLNQITTNNAATLTFPGNPWNWRCAQKMLSRIMHWAAKGGGYLSAAPHIQLSPADGRKLRISDDEAAALLKHMSRDCADAIRAIQETGMRIGEVLAIRWEHLNFEAGECLVPRRKTAERVVPISDRWDYFLKERKAYVESHEAFSKSEWVFPSERSSVGRRLTISKEFRKARKAADVNPKIVPYCFRHEFGSSYLEEPSADLMSLSAVMGHTDIATTNRYLHRKTDGAKKVIDARNKGKLQIVKSA